MLVFEKNSGQYPSDVSFVGKGKDWIARIRANGIGFEWPLEGRTGVMRIRYEGADLNAVVSAYDQLPGKINYIINAEPASWVTDIPLYSHVKAENIYPGIDVIYYHSNNTLEFDFKIQPFADPSLIRISFDEHSIPEISDEGKLKFPDAAGIPGLDVPVAFQIIDGVQRQIPVTYHINDDKTISLSLAEYDHSKELLIDPLIEFSSYLGGSGSEEGFNVVIKNGFLYVAGTTESSDFPTLNPYQSVIGTIRSSYIAKFSISGAALQLVYSTYIGNDIAELRGLVVDNLGNAYITGSTSSTNFPLVNPVQSLNAGIIDGYIVKLNPQGNALVYSTYFGGNSIDRGRAMAIDTTGSVYVTGVTASTDFPSVNAWQANNAGQLDAYVLKLKPNGSSYDYVTYLGGTSLDYGAGISLDDNNGVFVTGASRSTDLPAINALQTNNAGGYDAFVVNINSTGTPVYFDYIGGSGDDAGTDVGMDSSGRIVIFGQTQSSNFPLTVQQTYSDGEAFLTSIDLVSSQYNFSRYLGGSGSDSAWRMAIDTNDVAHVVGDTTSMDYPLLDPTQSTPGGGTDGYVSSLSLVDGTLLYSSYIGGSLTDRARGVSKEAGYLVVTGVTASTNLPLQQPYQAINKGGNDSFILLINMDRDGDSSDDYFDNCPNTSNSDQLDTDTDGLGNVCDDDDDNDGLPDSFENSIGSNPLLVDTDGDTLNDYFEVAYDGDAGNYNPALDLNPTSTDTDNDGLQDNNDPIPLTFNFNDGDLAPLGSPDGAINAADFLIAKRLALGELTATTLELSHGDLFPVGSPDGVIGTQDLLLQLNLLQ